MPLLSVTLLLTPPGAPNASGRFKPLPERLSPPTMQTAPAKLFDAPNWPALHEQLNRLPTFTVANERGQPLQYESPAGEPLAVFYSDVEAAKKELADALKM